MAKIRFLSVEKLVGDLSRGLVDERMSMIYYLISLLILLVATQYALWWGPRSGWLFHFELIFLVIVTIFGCLLCWSANGKEFGKSFVFRIVCFSVPSGIRVTVLSIAFGLLVHLNADLLLEPWFPFNPAVSYDLISYAGFIGFNVYFWYLLHRGFVQLVQLDQDR